jgi:hypothetical protein
MKRALCVLAVAVVCVAAGFAGSASAVLQRCGDVPSEQAALAFSQVSDECGTVPAAQPAPPEAGVFLCYSKFQTIPGVWPASEAKLLLTQGYTLPQVVQGNVAGGTNMGTFHLACNQPSVVATPTIAGYIGSDGTIFGPGFAGVPGLYPIYK